MKKVYWITSFIVILGLLLGACAPAATPVPTAVPTAVPPTATKVPPTNTPVPPTPTATIEPAPDYVAVFKGVVATMPADKGFSSVAPAALNTELAEKPPFMLDVREAAELDSAGYIKGSVNIPMRDVLKNLDKLPGLDSAIVVYCTAGHRGGIVMAALKALGYKNVRNIGGGLNAWVAANLPVEKGSKPAAPAVNANAAKVPQNRLFNELQKSISDIPAGFLAIQPADLNAKLADKATAPMLIDVRPASEIEKNGYIAGGVNMPMDTFFASLDKLPKKDAAIVVYCGSGHRSAVVMMGLRMLGYTNVLNMNGGINLWKSSKLPVAGVVDWMAVWTDFITNLPKDFYSIAPTALNTALADPAKAPFMLDVREASEVKDNFIKGSVNIPVRDVLTNLDKLPAQDKPIVVLCASGHRGAMVMAALRLLGWKDVTNLGGGISAWTKASLKVETGVPAAPKAGTAPKVDETRLKDLSAFLSGLPNGFYAVSPADLNTELAASPAPVLLDVRTAEEIKTDGYIKDSLMIPVNDVFKSLDKLPKDKAAKIVVVCKSGHRAAIAMMALRMNGYTNVRNLGGGIGAWTTAKLPLQK
jgi:rhodanese-related sulfurtransferase